MTSPTGRWIVPAILLCAIGLVVLSPLRWPCPMATLAHVPCPTCGMTRATRLALHGDFAGATLMHPLVWLVVPLLAAALAVEVVGYVRTGEWGAAGNVRGATLAMIATSVLLFVVWIARFFGALGGPVPV